MQYDITVIGLGVMGSATLYYLSKEKNLKILGIEQFESPHEYGSSHGESRIIRLAYSEAPFYVPFLFETYKEWKKLQEKAKDKLVFEIGGLMIGPKNSWILEGLKKSSLEYKLPIEEMNNKEVFLNLSQNFH